MDIKFFSSLLFLTNVIVNFYLQNYIYAILFLLLSITSLTHHYYNTNKTFIYDQISLYLVIFYGGYIFYNKNYNMSAYYFIILMFVFCFILYFIGKKYKHFCFHKNKNVANKYHAFMHFCASFGHHLIVLI
jgi:hypothetical protein